VGEFEDKEEHASLKKFQEFMTARVSWIKNHHGYEGDQVKRSGKRIRTYKVSKVSFG
jgi:hypothetical protein